jgi:hypothetical protein
MRLKEKQFQCGFSSKLNTSSNNHLNRTGLNMKKFAVLTSISVLAYAPVAFAGGATVSNTAINGTVATQSNTATNAVAVQGGYIKADAVQVQTGGVTNSGGVATVTNFGVNANILQQNNTAVNSTVIQGGWMYGNAEQTQVGLASGNGNAAVKNYGINGNAESQVNKASVEHKNKGVYVAKQGGSMEGYAYQYQQGAAVATGRNASASVTNVGINGNLLYQTNTAVNNGGKKVIFAAGQGGNTYGAAYQQQTGAAVVIAPVYTKPTHKHYSHK